MRAAYDYNAVFVHSISGVVTAVVELFELKNRPGIHESLDNLSIKTRAEYER